MFSRILTLLLLCCGQPALADWYEQDISLMGTEIHVAAWHDDDLAAADAVGAVLQEIQRINALMSTYEESSEISRVNREAAVDAVPVSPELFQLVQRSLAISRQTGGAFDITYASVGHLYDYRNQTKPEPDALNKKLEAISFEHVLLDKQASTIRFKHPDVRIDLGGIAKGYAVDRSIELLRKRNIRHAMVTAGGDTRVLGKRQDRPWIVGIQNPRDESEVVAVIPLVDESISTSGDYERYFDENGIRYHHIIDPETGDSARSLHSVSILGPESTLADALSTSLFVLGLESGIELIDSIHGYEAILVDQQGRLHYSTGLQQYAEAGQSSKDSLTGTVSHLANSSNDGVPHEITK